MSSYAFQVFPPQSLEYARLCTAAAIFDELCRKNTHPEYTHKVKTTYFNYGQGWKYTTIIRYDSTKSGGLSSYQLLNPREQEEIINIPIEALVEYCKVLNNEKP